MLVILLAAAAVQTTVPAQPPAQVVPVGPAAVCPHFKPALIPVGGSTKPALDRDPERFVPQPYFGPSANALDREPLRTIPHTLQSEPDAAHCLATPAG
jgi:hypothetical protein